MKPTIPPNAPMPSSAVFVSVTISSEPAALGAESVDGDEAAVVHVVVEASITDPTSFIVPAPAAPAVPASGVLVIIDMSMDIEVIAAPASLLPLDSDTELRVPPNSPMPSLASGPDSASPAAPEALAEALPAVASACPAPAAALASEVMLPLGYAVPVWSIASAESLAIVIAIDSLEHIVTVTVVGAQVPPVALA